MFGAVTPSVRPEGENAAPRASVTPSANVPASKEPSANTPSEKASAPSAKVTSERASASSAKVTPERTASFAAVHAPIVGEARPGAAASARAQSLRAAERTAVFGALSASDAKTGVFNRVAKSSRPQTISRASPASVTAERRGSGERYRAAPPVGTVRFERVSGGVGVLPRSAAGTMRFTPVTAPGRIASPQVRQPRVEPDAGTKARADKKSVRKALILLSAAAVLVALLAVIITAVAARVRGQSPRRSLFLPI